MPNEWLCQIGDQTRGPLPHSELASMAASGQLRPTDQVKKPEWSRWIQAAHVVGLKFDKPTEPKAPVVVQPIVAAKPPAPPKATEELDQFADIPPVIEAAPISADEGSAAVEKPRPPVVVKPQPPQVWPAAKSARTQVPPLPAQTVPTQTVPARPRPVGPVTLAPIPLDAEPRPTVLKLPADAAKPSTAKPSPSQVRTDIFSCFCPQCKATLSAPSNGQSEIVCWNCGNRWDVNTLIHKSTDLLRQHELSHQNSEWPKLSDTPAGTSPAGDAAAAPPVGSEPPLLEQ